MNRAWWLLFSTVLLSVWNAGIVWFTQIAVYPLWPLVDAGHFHDYHLTWWHDMRPSFVPVILMLFCSVALLWNRPTGISKRFLWLGIELNAWVQVEGWKAPLLKSGLQHDATAAAQFTWYLPKFNR